MAPTPGLLCVRSRITSEALSDAVFNDFYTNHHLPDFISSGVADLALRYKNADSSKKWQYLAVYRLPDIGFLSDPEKMEKIRMQHETLPNGGNIKDYTELNSKIYLPIQSFKGQGHKTGRANVLFIAEIEPAEKTDEEALGDFYEKQHFHMLSMHHQYHRSNRFKTVDGSKPRFAALHEFDNADLDQHMRTTMNSTKWSKDIEGNAQILEISCWELITEQGKIGENLIVNDALRVS
ncbi:uncharacterized protein BDZ99DRAFT_125278 [Mytilinidion resinicola]|uniref:EthD domain-containing protein n=1 Tax=Mytilinidion resinicola TaxID=574789 RepID=A0A6A6Z5F5_9PEZI|nr:uncharacterized protein BDZ99DRAFT_125278 [Mytilinidion resinicola]KAF2815893.1 hypothetical protein BDZ99DRAFT_125278 [Mytilinidion resinicola]